MYYYFAYTFYEHQDWKALPASLGYGILANESGLNLRKYNVTN